VTDAAPGAGDDRNLSGQPDPGGAQI